MRPNPLFFKTASSELYQCNFHDVYVVLRCSHQVVVAYGTHLPVDFLSRLFEPNSLMLTARLSHYQEVSSLFHIIRFLHFRSFVCASS